MIQHYSSIPLHTDSIFSQLQNVTKYHVPLNTAVDEADTKLYSVSSVKVDLSRMYTVHKSWYKPLTCEYSNQKHKCKALSLGLEES